MSDGLSLLEFDSTVDTRDEAAQLSVLIRSLRMQRGFGLYFVCVSQAEQRRHLIEEVRNALPGFHLQDVFLREPLNGSLLAHFQDTVPNLPAAQDASSRTIICLYGLEGWLAGEEAVQASGFAADINTTRNSFPAALNCPLVFFVPQYILTGLMLGAPDFFSIRNGHYFFDTPPEKRNLPILEAMESAEFRAAKGAGVEGRRRQAAEWEEILNGYRALPAERRDRLAEAFAQASLGTVHFAGGNFALAQPLYEQALAIRREILGEEHPDTVKNRNDLSRLYSALGSYDNALSLLDHALSMHEDLLEIEDSETAKSLQNLACLYTLKGDYIRALPLFERVLAIYENILGEDHPDTASSLNNLASLCFKTGNRTRALSLSERSLAITEKTLGADHPNVASNLNNLASLYFGKGEYARALPLLERALTIQEKALGPEHADTAVSLNNLAGLYSRLGRYAKSLPLYERALTIREKAVGTEHPDTAASLYSLAAQYSRQGDYAKSLPLYERALSIWEKTLGQNHPTTQIGRDSLVALQAKMRTEAPATRWPQGNGLKPMTLPRKTGKGSKHRK